MIDGCPYDLLTQDAVEAIRIAGFWEKGIPPVDGGYLDQTESMIQAAELIWSDEAKIEAERSKPRHGA